MSGTSSLLYQFTTTTAPNFLDWRSVNIPPQAILLCILDRKVMLVDLFLSHTGGKELSILSLNRK